jgi:hypothetical protein
LIEETAIEGTVIGETETGVERRLDGISMDQQRGKRNEMQSATED